MGKAKANHKRNEAERKWKRDAENTTRVIAAYREREEKRRRKEEAREKR